MIRENARSVRRALLAWYTRQARPLPWRKNRSPYRIWVSEVMLQQTQVATVVPYYRRFLRAFPTLQHLSRARLEKVLELWSGLGYYRRARQLHQAAKDVVKRFGGRFPSDFDEVRSLAGIGDYTARALASLAFNLPYPVLDGNVARVVARLDALNGGGGGAKFRRDVEQRLQLLLSRRQPSRFNQAMMELGQTVCLPRAPRCQSCPLRLWCKGFRVGTPENYPLPRRRRKTEIRHMAAGILKAGPRVAVVRGLDEGLLADMWNFPAAFGKSPAEARKRLRENLRAILGTPVRLGGPIGNVQHGITFRSVSARIYRVETGTRAPMNSVRWLDLSSFDRAAVSQLARKIARAALHPSARDME